MRFDRITIDNEVLVSVQLPMPQTANGVIELLAELPRHAVVRCDTDLEAWWTEPAA